ncbi:MAG: DUF72 domain-containing protein [Nitrososphaeraceae archaeon]
MIFVQSGNSIQRLTKASCAFAATAATTRRAAEMVSYRLNYDEGPWDMLRHYNIAAVMTDSPARENLQFLSDITITTAEHSFVRLHGRNTKDHYWYNYLYSKEELKPWAEKVSQIKQQTKVLRVYFNNHYGGKAVVNALEFKEMIGTSLSVKEKNVIEEAKSYLSNKQILSEGNKYETRSTTERRRTYQQILKSENNKKRKEKLIPYNVYCLKLKEMAVATATTAAAAK